MERCIDCIHHEVCKKWSVDAFGDASLFPYEAEDNLCEHYKPVVHGEWIEFPLHPSLDKCSECGYIRQGVKFNYCANCGALMDGGK